MTMTRNCQTIQKKEDLKDCYKAGIVYAFRPERIEYVIKGNESTKELDKLVSRGITLVKVIPVDKEGKQIKISED